MFTGFRDIFFSIMESYIIHMVCVCVCCRSNSKKSIRKTYKTKIVCASQVTLPFDCTLSYDTYVNRTSAQRSIACVFYA